MKATGKVEARRAWDAGNALRAGRIFYEHLRVADQPGWAVASLNLVSRLIPPVAEIGGGLSHRQDPARWHEAHAVFQAIRRLALRENEQLRQGVLTLAENTQR